MPVILKGKAVAPQANAAGTPRGPPRGPRPDEAELAAKRAGRGARRAKYQLIRKDKTARDYQRIKVFVDGKEMRLTESSLFLIDMLLADKES